MKKILLTLIIAISFTVHAETDPVKEKPILLELRDRKQTQRPKAPSRQKISCIYSAGKLLINFLIDEGDATLAITNKENGQVSVYNFNTAFPTEIAVGELTSAYIKITTAAGNEYEGEL